MHPHIYFYFKFCRQSYKKMLYSQKIFVTLHPLIEKNEAGVSISHHAYI